MPTKSKSSKQVKLKRGDGGGTEVFTTIGEITGVDGPSPKAPQLDATSCDSTAKEFIADLVDNGECNGDLLFVGSDAQQQGLVADMEAGTVRNFKLDFNDHASDPSIFSFAAIVTAFSTKVAVGAVVKANFGLKISGAINRHYRPS